MARTLDNCTTITTAVREGTGTPVQKDGECYGYAKAEDDDEPSDVCSRCPLYVGYELR